MSSVADLKYQKLSKRYLSRVPGLHLPGTDGNYASIPDVNLLDADTAHLHQSQGAWAVVGASPVGLSNVRSLIGDNSLHMVSDGVDLFPVMSPKVSIVAGQKYSTTVQIYGDVIVDVRNRLDWYDNTGTRINLSNGVWGQTVAGGWTEFTVTATAPVGAVEVEVRPHITNAVLNDEFWMDKVCLRKGPDPTFVPSTRITGDLDLRFFGAADDWTPGAQSALVAKWDGTQRSYLFRLQTNGTVKLFLSDDGSTFPSATSSMAVPFTNEEFNGLQVTWRQSDGRVQFFTADNPYDPKNTAWTQLGVDQTLTLISIHDGTSPLEVGSQDGGLFTLASNIQQIQTLDGIDGPIVASADFTRYKELTEFETPEGHTFTINGANSELGVPQEMTKEDMLVEYFWDEFNGGIKLVSGDDLREFYLGQGAVGDSIQDLAYNYWTNFVP